MTSKRTNRDRIATLDAVCGDMAALVTALPPSEDTTVVACIERMSLQIVELIYLVESHELTLAKLRGEVARRGSGP